MIPIPPPEIQSVVSQSEARAIAIREVQKVVTGRVEAVVVEEKDVERGGRKQKRIIFWDWNQTEPRRWVAWVTQGGEVSEFRDITPHGYAKGKGKAKTRHHGEREITGLIDDADGTFIAYDEITAVVEAKNAFPYPDGQPVAHTLEGTTFGDGSPYEDRTLYTSGNYPPELRTPNATTPAGEAMLYAQTALDFNKTVLGYEGVRGFPSPVFLMVHAGFQYDNAFAALGLCDCFYFGDGSWFLNQTALTNTTNLDVVAHEIAHATTYWTANLDYYGEAGGLNEATSDIFAKATQWWFEAGKPASIPTPAKDKWTLGETTLLVNGKYRALRWMDKPSRDGASYDFVDPIRMANDDPHYTSGPLNRWFYWIVNGVPAFGGAEDGSPYTPAGYPYQMPVEKAAKIWFQTIHRNLLPEATYADAASGAHQSAIELYGPESAEAHAVRWTFAAIKAIPSNDLPPYVTTVYPTEVAPGADVTLTGAQFVNTTQVFVGGESVGTFNPANTGQLKFTLPAGAKSGPVVVQTQFGRSPAGPVLTIAEKPVIKEFTVDPMVYVIGDSVTARWSVEKSTRVLLNGERVGVTGQVSVVTNGPTTLFRLEVDGTGGEYVEQTITARAAVPDLNGDGAVDAYDAIALVANWGKPGASDLNGDGTTDAADLFILKGMIE